MGSVNGYTADVPIVDFSSFRGDQYAEQHLRGGKELVRACQENGCVGITGHGLSDDTLRQLFATAKTLFDMPLDEQLKAPHPLNSYVPHRGYTGVGGEKCFTIEEMMEHGHDESFRDTKTSSRTTKSVMHAETLMQTWLNRGKQESFEVGSEDNKTHYNIWYPEEVFPGFRSFTLKAYWELHTICMQILDAFLLGLDLTEEETKAIRSLHTGLNDQLRLLHYPALPSAIADDPESGRLQAHTDWSTFTLLFQDSCGGLEFGNRKVEGGFMPATPKDGVVYLNAGDMLARISNDLLPSAQHRVVVPQKRITTDDGQVTTPPRYSVPFFFLPDDDKIVATPKSLVASHGSQKYEPITMLEYADLRSKWFYKEE